MARIVLHHAAVDSLTVFWLLTGGAETGITLNMIVPQDMAWRTAKRESGEVWTTWYIRQGDISVCPALNSNGQEIE